MKNLRSGEFWREVLLLALIGGVIFVPRALHLGTYVVADEPRYLSESADFYYALTHDDLGGTHQIIHPGVTTMWIGAAAFAWQLPEYQDLGEARIPDLTLRKILMRNESSNLLMLSYARLLMTAVISGLLLIGFTQLRRLFGARWAIFGILLAAFDPFYFAHSRFLVTDGLLASLMFVSLLGFLVYLHRGSKGSLVLSAVMAGASWITKVPGVLLIPAVGLLVGLEVWRQKDYGSIKDKLKNQAGPVLIWLGTASLTALLLWPALWVDAPAVLQEIFSFTLDQGSAAQLSPTFFKGQQILSGSLGLDYWDYYPLVFLWRSTPVILAGLVSLAVFWRRKASDDPEAAKALIGLLLYALVFTVLMTLSKKKFDRYLLPIFPPLALASAAGWMWLIEWLSTKIWEGSRTAAKVCLVMIAALQVVPVIQTTPYYLSYYNTLLGGAEQAVEVFPVGWGEGLDQAARYLNEKPDILNQRVYAFYAAAFNFHFGAFEPSPNARANPVPWYDAEEFFAEFDADYIVLYRNQVQRGLSQPVLDYLADREPEKVITINGIEYAWIYAAENPSSTRE